jgi:hypothetical protein
MYSTFFHQIAQDRVADLHRDARHDTLARAARQGGGSPKRQPRHRMPRFPAIVMRSVRTAWGTHA